VIIAVYMLWPGMTRSTKTMKNMGAKKIQKNLMRKANTMKVKKKKRFVREI